jgi:hypothetical protein
MWLCNTTYKYALFLYYFPFTSSAGYVTFGPSVVIEKQYGTEPSVKQRRRSTLQEERGIRKPVAGGSNELIESTATESQNKPTFTASDIEGALWGLKSFRDILVACEEEDTRVHPIAVGTVLEILLKDFEKGLGMQCS